MMSINLPEIVENEWYLVRYSGENPEIAFHSSIYHLTEDREGPCICLEECQFDTLQNAAADRFSEIILRDLLHTNNGTPIYRGIRRSIVNYRRFCNFCERQQKEWPEVRKTAARALRSFLEMECEAIQSSGRQSIVNCTREELGNFAMELGIVSGPCLKKVKKMCASDE